jgi:hypothetical protein
MSKNARGMARKAILGLLVILLAGLAMFSRLSLTPAFAQQPTGSIATVTGTREGPKIIVYADQNIIGVFAGPSAYLYPQVGILLAGEEAPALGYSVDTEWIKIIYLGTPGGSGWVYAPFVSILGGGSLVVLPNPPTATPRTTPTINPTQAALYGVQLTPQNLPTFTEPAPLVVPVFDVTSGARTGLPMGLVILVLLLVGVLGAVISFLRGR